MQKKVNIYPQRPITTINPPIRSTIKGVYMPIDIIRECIINRAIVEEVLDNGEVVNLDFTNFDKDNETPVEFVAPKEAEPVALEEPIIEDETILEEPTVEEVVETADIEEASIEAVTEEKDTTAETENIHKSNKKNKR